MTAIRRQQRPRGPYCVKNTPRHQLLTLEEQANKLRRAAFWLQNRYIRRTEAGVNDALAECAGALTELLLQCRADSLAFPAAEILTDKLLRIAAICNE